jgi:hypothetical protein
MEAGGFWTGLTRLIGLGKKADFDRRNMKDMRNWPA